MEGSLVAYKVFTNGSVLNASDINDNLMNQSVMVFSNSTARAAALTAPVEGMLTWLQDTNKYENYNGSAWVALGGSGVLQVVSTTKTDTFTMASTTYADLTGLSVSITPSSATSKIYVMATISASSTPGVVTIQAQLMRGSTAIAIGDAAGSRTRASTAGMPQTASEFTTLGVDFLDSPATTSATTYKIQVRANTANTVAVNRTVTDSDNVAFSRNVSTITVMEVAG
jgi:hypothetical protein